ncbi:MAG: hypothetical protein C4334_09275, partial [Pyrinomonas sp.]|uniref:hypothetical protein n=1 Tax=Pyrinomonas sp. TaxID=2080306 RepID=UPI00331F154A
MSIRSIGKIQHETLVDPPQAETAATQAAEQAQAQPSGEMVRAEAQWQHQVQRWHVLAQLERSTNGQASSS